MIRLVPKRLRDFFGRGFKPFQFGLVEAFIFRLLTAVTIFLLSTVEQPNKESLPLPGEFHLPDQPNPNGIAHLIDITWISDPAIYPKVYYAMVALAVAYVIGIGLPVILPLLAGLHILIFTLANSQGAIGHDNQILSIVLLAQAVAVCLPHLFARRGWNLPQCTDTSRISIRDFMLNTTLQVIAACYVVTGLAKLFESKGLWVWQTPDLVVEIVKTNHQRGYTKALEAGASIDQADTIAFMTDHPWLTRLFLGGGFFFELFAFMALYNRLWALVFGLGLFAMHRCILWLMKLGFPENERLLIIYLINIPFWIILITGFRKRDRTAAS